tara:strand:+ start:61 stop:774 length:714 start_codon:yes stop_codon:yes gene_type:complete
MATTKIQGHSSGSGSVTVTAPNTNSNRTLTLPDADVTIPNGLPGADAGYSKNVLSAQGDILYASGANTLARLAAGGASKTLKMNSSNNAPEWVTVPAGTIVAAKTSTKTDLFTIGTTYTAITGISITHEAADSNNLIIFWFSCTTNSGTAGDFSFVLNDGSADICKGDSGNGDQITWAQKCDASRFSGCSFTASHTPGTGSKTYTVKAQAPAAGGQIGQTDTDYRSFTCLNLMEVTV